MPVPFARIIVSACFLSQLIAAATGAMLHAAEDTGTPPPRALPAEIIQDHDADQPGPWQTFDVRKPGQTATTSAAANPLFRMPSDMKPTTPAGRTSHEANPAASSHSVTNAQSDTPTVAPAVPPAPPTAPTEPSMPTPATAPTAPTVPTAPAVGVPLPAGNDAFLRQPLPGDTAGSMPASEECVIAETVGDEYRIHTGDWLIISIPYEADTRMEVPVRPDGRITYLFNIEIVAAGLTYRELHAALIKELSRYYRTPAATIAAKSFAGNAVYVMGPVLKPGAHTIQNDSRLLEVLASAGVLNLLPQMNADQDYSSPVRDVVDLKGAYIARGDKILDVNFEQLLIKGDMSQNIPVLPRDFIFIPSSYLTNFQKRIYICGSVKTPKVYRYSGEATLVEAVSDAGGPLSDVADSRNCFLIRRSNKTPKRIDYFSIIKGRSDDMAIEDGDIIYFPERSLHYGSKAVSTVISEIVAPLQSVLDADAMTKRYHQHEWSINGPINQ